MYGLVVMVIVICMVGAVMVCDFMFFFFFFQAEDGIRDLIVTGVQTCALPILRWLCYLKMRRT